MYLHLHDTINIISMHVHATLYAYLAMQNNRRYLAVTTVYSIYIYIYIYMLQCPLCSSGSAVGAWSPWMEGSCSTLPCGGEGVRTDVRLCTSSTQNGGRVHCEGEQWKNTSCFTCPCKHVHCRRQYIYI